MRTEAVDLEQTGGAPGPYYRAKPRTRKEQRMLDVILLAVGLGFFALSVAYTYGCDHL